ncbi:MAG: manganese-dependent inorganic pyrophosphatase [Actinomycetia bacterium]|nr:manganese-dependent inorganic pyrophosphatase [Actinomycetes bacterium]
MSTIYVFGHQHPDTDSLCSAVGAAYYLNMTETSGDEYIAARLGPVPTETAWVFERFGASAHLPEELPHFDDPSELSCVLVDHNEVAQSYEGIAKADIRMIIDHHRIGDIQTDGPITFINKPLGSTATITALHFQRTGVEMPDWLAGVLLSAILTDTTVLKSPTATDRDRKLAEELAARLGLDVLEYGMELFTKPHIDERFESDRVLHNDLKVYEAGGIKIGIVQFQDVTLEAIERHHDEVVADMARIVREEGWGLFLFMATDIMRDGTELFVSGDSALAEEAFHADFSSGEAWLPGVLSRKKQVAAAILEALG